MFEAKILPHSRAERLIEAMTPRPRTSRNDIVAALKAEVGISVNYSTVQRHQKRLGLL